MNRLVRALLVGFGLLLAACAAPAASAGQLAEPLSPPATQVATQSPPPASEEFPTRVDEQGAVIVEITPLDLHGPSDEIRFEVSLNTHSVDLSMDLAALASLTTDSGATVGATLWDAPRGGHHVGGTLIFPATADGASILDGARTLTLTILDLDAPVRTFEWQLD